MQTATSDLHFICSLLHYVTARQISLVIELKLHTCHSTESEWTLIGNWNELWSWLRARQIENIELQPRMKRTVEFSYIIHWQEKIPKSTKRRNSFERERERERVDLLTQERRATSRGERISRIEQITSSGRTLSSPRASCRRSLNSNAGRFAIAVIKRRKMKKKGTDSRSAFPNTYTFTLKLRLPRPKDVSE